LAEAGEISPGLALVQQAVRRLARPIRVKVLHPDPDSGQKAVDIIDLARFGGGEQLTAAILLYCSLAQLRARSRGRGRGSSTVLILDNPIGRASRVSWNYSAKWPARWAFSFLTRRGSKRRKAPVHRAA
jgi:hypothetical protein